MTELDYKELIDESLNEIETCDVCQRSMDKSNNGDDPTLFRCNFRRCLSCVVNERNIYCGHNFCLNIARNMRHSNVGHNFIESKLTDLNNYNNLPLQVAKKNKIMQRLNIYNNKIESVSNASGIVSKFLRKFGGKTLRKYGCKLLGNELEQYTVDGLVKLMVQIGVSEGTADTVTKYAFKNISKIPGGSVGVAHFCIGLAELGYLCVRIYKGEVTSKKEMCKELIRIVSSNSISFCCSAIAWSTMGPIGLVIALIVAQGINCGIEWLLNKIPWLKTKTNKSEAETIKKALLKFNINKNNLKDINLQELRKRYRQRAKECHPDRGGNASDFIALNMYLGVLEGLITKRKLNNKQFIKAIKYV